MNRYCRDALGIIKTLKALACDMKQSIVAANPDCSLAVLIHNPYKIVDETIFRRVRMEHAILVANEASTFACDPKRAVACDGQIENIIIGECRSIVAVE